MATPLSCDKYLKVAMFFFYPHVCQSGAVLSFVYETVLLHILPVRCDLRQLCLVLSSLYNQPHAVCFLALLYILPDFSLLMIFINDP